MSVLLRTGPVAPSFARGLCLAAAGATLALAGCSASITRFDNPSFALGEGAGGTSARRTAGGSIIDSPALVSDAPAAPPRARGTEVASLPAIESQTVGAQVPPVRAMAVTKTASPQANAPAPAPSSAPARGQQIEVQQGDTLYGLSRKHNVLIVDLMSVNELKSPNLKPGQRLVLPATAGVRATPQVRPERVAAARPAPPPATSTPSTTATAAPEVAAAPPASDSGGTYTVRQGDSLYAIAARHKVKVLDLQRVNDISDVRKVKPGMVLKIPGQGSAVVQPAPSAVAGETMQPEARIVRVGGPASAAPPGVKLLNEAQPPSAAAPMTIAAAPAEPHAVQSGKLRWPVRGRVVQSFGPRADGSHNDGIDIAVPAGTDVLAAEGGVVAYAGNEVKTYGNLVLIRHDNGWVTAYAYNDKLLVQRGDRVKRGQPIAKAGRTGAADQPQVHFEVRVGSKPVDPTGYLEKL